MIEVTSRSFGRALVLAAAGAVLASATPAAASAALAKPSGLTLGAIPVGGSPRPAERKAAFGAPARAVGPHFDATTCVGSNLCYGGGPVLHGASTYVVFWAGPLNFSATYSATVAGFLQNVAAASGSVNNVYATDGQYGDASGPALDASTWGGSFVDSSPYPPSGCTDSGAGLGSPCLNDAQISAELARVAAAQGWPLGRGSVFFLMTPQGVGSCAADNSCSYQTGGFCAYHSVAGSGSGELIYADIPYANVSGCRPGGQFPNGGDVDPSLNTLSHEHNEMITDPEGNAWARPNGDEDGDLCRSSFVPALGGPPGSEYNQVLGSGHYYLQSEWSNMADPTGAPPPAGCAASLSDTPPAPSFSAPATILVGEPINLDASASSGSIISYSWHFDDATPDVQGRMAQHSFATTGQHTITLGVVDALGVPAKVARTVSVVDEPPTAVFAARAERKAGTLSFDGQASVDADGSIATYRWDFGDRTAAASGPLVTHTYAKRGQYTVTLQVTDVAGQTAAATQVVNVAVGGGKAATSSPPVVTQVVTNERLAALLKAGLGVRLHCTKACRLRIGLATVPPRGASKHSVSLGGASLRLRSAGLRTLAIHPGRGSAAKLAHVSALVLTVSWLDTRGHVQGSTRTSIHLLP